MKTTISHDEIKKWAEQFKGRPEVLPNSETETGAIGIRIDFPGKVDDMYLSDDHKPEYVSWEEFFKIFEAEELAMEYEEGNMFDNPSNAYRFLRRDNLSID